MGKQNFLKGTVILIIANAISKILGAIFKIPLTYLLKEEGMAIFNTAFSVYTVFLSFVISGFPLAISNITAKHYALKNYSYVKRIAFVSSCFLAILGFFASLLLFTGRDFFALAMKDPKAGLAIAAISPSVFFVALGTVYKGYFQGSVNMIPTAISQVTESIIRLIIGFAGAYLFINKGIEYSATGAISGITIGEILATLMLFLMFFYSKSKLADTGKTFSHKTAVKEICQIAVPMFLCSCILNGLSMIDTAVLRNSLLKITFTPSEYDKFINTYSPFTNCFDEIKYTLKMNITGARWLYGSYSGYALTIFNLPAGIIGALGVSILPVITGNLATNNILRVQKTASLALRLTTIIAFPFAFGMFLFGKDVLSLIFNNTASAGLLAVLAPCLVFLCIEQLFTALLHSAGFIIQPAICMAIGIIIKIICCFILVPLPEVNIYGAPLSSCFAYFVIMVLCAVLIKKKLKIRFYIKDSIIKPFFASVLMSIIMIFTITPLKEMLGTNLGFIACTILGGLFYFLVLILLRSLSFKEFKTHTT